VDGDLQISAIIIKRADDGHVALEGILSERPTRAKGEEARVAREHDAPKLFIGHARVADEGHPANAHAVVLGDLEEDFHLIVLLGDDLARRFGQEIALLGVLIADLLDAALNRRVADDAVFLDLDRFGQIFSIDLGVAFELDAAHVGPLADDKAQRDGARVPLEIDLDVIKEPGVPQLPDVLRERIRRKWLTRFHRQVGEDVFARDAPVARDAYFFDGHTSSLLGFVGPSCRPRGGA
jgi:hypothetical protein